MTGLVTSLYQQNQMPEPQPQPQLQYTPAIPHPGMEYQPQAPVGPVQQPQQNAIQPQHCTPEELKGYARAMMGFLPPGQGLTPMQAQTLIGMILGMQIPEPVQVQTFDPQTNQAQTTSERLLTINQDANYYNRGKFPKGVQQLNPAKRPLKNHHFSDPNEMRNMANFERNWEASQRGVPDVAGHPEIKRY